MGFSETLKEVDIKVMKDQAALLYRARGVDRDAIHQGGLG
jgi:hypothetical protein